VRENKKKKGSTTTVQFPSPFEGPLYKGMFLAESKQLGWLHLHSIKHRSDGILTSIFNYIV